MSVGRELSFSGLTFVDGAERNSQFSRTDCSLSDHEKMKSRLKHLLISAVVAAGLLSVESPCCAQSLPDLGIRMIK